MSVCGGEKAFSLISKNYEKIMELIEDLQGANDLLKAERESVFFCPTL